MVLQNALKLIKIPFLYILFIKYIKYTKKWYFNGFYIAIYLFSLFVTHYKKIEQNINYEI